MGRRLRHYHIGQTKTRRCCHPPNPNKATPAEQSAAPNQNLPGTAPGNSSALPTAVKTTLLPNTGVATDTSPPASARKVPTCPRKNRNEHNGGANHIHPGNSPFGKLAQKSKGKKDTPMAKFEPTITRLGDCPNSSALFKKSVPTA